MCPSLVSPMMVNTVVSVSAWMRRFLQELFVNSSKLETHKRGYLSLHKSLGMCVKKFIQQVSVKHLWYFTWEWFPQAHICGYCSQLVQLFGKEREGWPRWRRYVMGVMLSRFQKTCAILSVLSLFCFRSRRELLAAASYRHAFPLLYRSQPSGTESPIKLFLL